MLSISIAYGLTRGSKKLRSKPKSTDLRQHEKFSRFHDSLCPLRKYAETFFESAGALTGSGQFHKRRKNRINADDSM